MSRDSFAMAQGAFLCDSNRLQLIYLNDTRIGVLKTEQKRFIWSLHHKGGIITANNPLRSGLNYCILRCFNIIKWVQGNHFLRLTLLSASRQLNLQLKSKTLKRPPFPQTPGASPGCGQKSQDGGCSSVTKGLFFKNLSQSHGGVSTTPLEVPFFTTAWGHLPKSEMLPFRL